MKLVYKTITPVSETTSNGSISGGYTFEIMDYSGVTAINEAFLNSIDEKHAAVTTDASIKYVLPVFAYDYIEVYAEIVDVTRGSIEVNTVLKSRGRKSKDWKDCAYATFKFSIIDLDTRRIVRIPKEVINEIKG